MNIIPILTAFADWNWGGVTVVGITSNDKDINTFIDNYPFVQKEDINSLNFDYCIVAMANMSLMINEAESLGIEKSKLIPIRVLSIPNIDFNKLMMNLDTYMSYPVEFVKTGYTPMQKQEYPIGQLNDILLHFIHYEDFEQAASCWERRKKG